MIYLRELAKDSFILLRANWAVSKARELLIQSKATHVIVHRTEPDIYKHLTLQSKSVGAKGPPSSEVKDYYYLYTIEDAQKMVEGSASEDESVRTAFNLHEYEATPVHDGYSDAETAPDCGIVMDEGRIIGFVDAHVPPVQIRTKGLTRGSILETRATEAVPCTLKAEFPDTVPLQQTVSLLVSLSTEIEGGGAGQAQLPLAVPKGTNLDIVIQPKRGFIIDGLSEACMLVTDEEEIVQFRLKAVELGPSEIRILAFTGGQRLGTIILKPLIMDAAEPLSNERVAQEHDIVAIKMQEPDLYMLILQEQNTLTFRLKSLDRGLGLTFQPFGPVTLKLNPREHFNNFFEEIEKLPLANAHDKEIAQKKLEAKGTKLFQEVIPQDLQVLLWSLRDKIQSVQIQSGDSDIPWELCRLQGKENGRTVDGPFFCEAFAITRCLDRTAPKPTLSLKNIALVIPKDSKLPYAASERDYMLSLANGGRRVDRIPANFIDLKKTLAKGEYDGWHFTGHGDFKGEHDFIRTAMLLEKFEEMVPEDLCDETQNLGQASPLVFLNACRIGRSAMSLTDIGGWAGEFLRAGAGAFIGAYWSIYDQAANDFAKAFYSKLLAGMEIGRAVKEARMAIKPLGDPTWLAYTVFADPLAKVQ